VALPRPCTSRWLFTTSRAHGAGQHYLHHAARTIATTSLDLAPSILRLHTATGQAPARAPGLVLAKRSNAECRMQNALVCASARPASKVISAAYPPASNHSRRSQLLIELLPTRRPCQQAAIESLILDPWACSAPKTDYPRLHWRPQSSCIRPSPSINQPVSSDSPSPHACRSSRTRKPNVIALHPSKAVVPILTRFCCLFCSYSRYSVATSNNPALIADLCLCNSFSSSIS
jgi:hypothetical protein